MKKRLPTIFQLLDALERMPDEKVRDLSKVIGGIAQVYLGGWIFKRNLRKIGPVLAKVQRGEQLSASDSRLLLTTLSYSAYLAARNAYSGWSSAKQSVDAATRLNHKQEQSA